MEGYGQRGHVDLPAAGNYLHSENDKGCLQSFKSIHRLYTKMCVVDITVNPYLLLEISLMGYFAVCSFSYQSICASSPDTYLIFPHIRQLSATQLAYSQNLTIGLSLAHTQLKLHVIRYIMPLLSCRMRGRQRRQTMFILIMSLICLIRYLS